jgi:hypothetical protein
MDLVVPMEAAMKNSINRNATRITVVSVLLMVSAGVIAIVQAGGLATRPVAKISGELAITDESGARQAVVVANVDYLQSTKEGTAHLAIRRDGVRVAAVNARIRADTQEQAAAAVSALILHLTNRNGRPGVQCSDINERGGLQCSDIRSEGDPRVFAEQADKIIDWWDAHASLTHAGYVSPRPSLTSLGKLQINVWGKHAFNGDELSSYAVLFFDSGDATKIVGGSLVSPVPQRHLNVISGTLVDNGNTPAPGDFLLNFDAEEGFAEHFTAEVAIEALPDGSADVRGVANTWNGVTGKWIVEGIGNTKFVVPARQ